MPMTEEIIRYSVQEKTRARRRRPSRSCTQGWRRGSLETQETFVVRQSGKRRLANGQYVEWSKQCRVKNWRLSGTILKTESQGSGDCEPMLASFYHATLLKHENLGSALSYMLRQQAGFADYARHRYPRSGEEAYAADQKMIATAA
ncbi:serine O-acetyltransferase [Shigella flexneri]